MKKHGMSGTSLYACWRNAKSRGYNKNDPAYERYGGRGIDMCAEWRNDFPAFKKYVDEHCGQKPSPKHSLDRRNNYLQYQPGNLQWSTSAEQAANRRCHGRSGYKGVYETPGGRFRAEVRVKGRRVLSKTFRNIYAAAQAVNECYALYHPNCLPPNQLSPKQKAEAMAELRANNPGMVWIDGAGGGWWLAS